MQPYLEKVRTGAFAVTNDDVAELKRAGSPRTRSSRRPSRVAIGEGLRRLDAALRVIG
jgi:hypothetical protein